jgi:DinB superfamily
VSRPQGAPLNTEHDDLIELFDYVYGRLAGRLEGLGDDEWAWCPTPDDRVSLRWRLQHITEMLSEDRNWRWLRAPMAPPPAVPHAETAAAAVAGLGAAFAAWRALLGALSDAELAEPIGAAAGDYGDATRRSFVLHIADELIHHSAEAALLRDLYAVV